MRDTTTIEDRFKIGQEVDLVSIDTQYGQPVATGTTYKVYNVDGYRLLVRHNKAWRDAKVEYWGR